MSIFILPLVIISALIVKTVSGNSRILLTLAPALGSELLLKHTE